MQNLGKYIFTTATQKILDFLAGLSGEQFTEKEIAKATGVKKSAVNLALRELVSQKIIIKEKVGRTSLYNADGDNYVVKEIKVLRNILEISPLLEKLKPVSRKIILFGSAAKGENTNESDIDLFILTNDPALVRKIISYSSLKNKIQLIVKTLKEMFLINKKKPLFFQEIEKGRVLYENYGE